MRIVFDGIVGGLEPWTPSASLPDDVPDDS
jgi:hypothetical protein